MSSMRPPILAGPMPRKTKRLSMGSSDQLIGVGVGVALGEGVAVGDWFGPVGGGDCCAWLARVANVCAQSTAHSQAMPRAAADLSLMWAFLPIKFWQLNSEMTRRERACVLLIRTRMRTGFARNLGRKNDR